MIHIHVVSELVESEQTPHEINGNSSRMDNVKVLFHQGFKLTKSDSLFSLKKRRTGLT